MFLFSFLELYAVKNVDQGFNVGNLFRLIYLSNLAHVLRLRRIISPRIYHAWAEWSFEKGSDVGEVVTEVFCWDNSSVLNVLSSLTISWMGDLFGTLLKSWEVYWTVETVSSWNDIIRNGKTEYDQHHLSFKIFASTHRYSIDFWSLDCNGEYLASIKRNHILIHYWRSVWIHVSKQAEVSVFNTKTIGGVASVKILLTYYFLSRQASLSIGRLSSYFSMNFRGGRSDLKSLFSERLGKRYSVLQLYVVPSVQEYPFRRSKTFHGKFCIHAHYRIFRHFC